MTSEDYLPMYSNSKTYKGFVDKGTQMILYFAMDRSLLSGYFSNGYYTENTFAHLFAELNTSSNSRYITQDIPDIAPDGNSGVGGGAFTCSTYSVFQITQSVTDWYNGYGLYIDTTYGPWEYTLVSTPTICPVPSPEELDPVVVAGRPITPLKLAKEKDMEAYLWEEEICEKENFSNNDCVKGIWNTIKSNNVAFDAIKRYLSDNAKAELCLDVKNLGSGDGEPNGTTAPTITTNNGQIVSASVVININSEKLDRSKLIIARTMLHEMYHAQLYSMVIEAGWYDHLEEYASNYTGEDDFQMIWAYYKQYGSYMEGNTGYQHEYMADHYIQDIANGLAELKESLISESFINFADAGNLDPDSGVWSWDDFFYYLAWEGLHESDQFETDIVNQGKEGAYNFYREHLKLEVSSHRCQ